MTGELQTPRDDAEGRARQILQDKIQLHEDRTGLCSQLEAVGSGRHQLKGDLAALSVFGHV